MLRPNGNLLLILLFVIPGCSPQANPAGKGGGTQSTPAPPAPVSIPPLTLSLDNSFPEKNTAGDALREHYSVVARDVVEVVQKRFSGFAPLDRRPIVCHASDSATPFTDASSSPTSIQINIAMQDTLDRLDDARFAYQLAHELGHVMMDARRTNALIETIADALSYQVLEDLTALWQQRYTDPWKSWAPNFVAYRQEREKYYLARFPQQIQTAVAQGRWEEVTAYLQEHQAELEKDPFTSDGTGGFALRSLGATALLSQSVPWKRFVGIATFTDPSPDQDGRYRTDLPILLKQVPNDARAAIARFR
jgi:hypothetical protein